MVRIENSQPRLPLFIAIHTGGDFELSIAIAIMGDIKGDMTRVPIGTPHNALVIDKDEPGSKILERTNGADDHLGLAGLNLRSDNGTHRKTIFYGLPGQGFECRAQFDRGPEQPTSIVKSIQRSAMLHSG
ncbi:MAG: hypothetical protein BWY83_02133 [bacterium ADurb.Bin478]|nr:MAG: hypothetical protein BWY83_02133 [bacterium ADurb.Bin478]